MIQYASASVSAGTVTATIYQGAASTATFCVKNPGTACSNSITVPVTSASPGGTTSGVPTLTSVTPSPIQAGTVTVTISGSGFVTGALLYDSYGTQSMIQYAPATTSAGSLTATIFQGPATSTTFCVKNPGTACSNSITVPVNSGPRHRRPSHRLPFCESWGYTAVHIDGSDRIYGERGLYYPGGPLYRSGNDAGIEQGFDHGDRTWRDRIGHGNADQSESAGHRSRLGPAEPGGNAAIHFHGRK